MPRFLSFRAAVRLALALLFAAPAPLAAIAQTTPGVVISQVYGGGGNSGATYKNDFIELFNQASTAQTLTNYSVQYASSTGTSWQVTPLAATVTLQPGQFYLIQEAPGAAGTTNLPTPDATGSINMSSSAGKVALVSSTTALSGSCPTATSVDFVGFGSAANCYLGSGPTATLTNTTAALRSPVCKYTPDNAKDFTTGAATPRNTATATQACAGGTALSVTAQATPASVFSGNTTLLTATVTPATSPASTGLQVTADLTALGGYSTQPLYDDGTHGDLTAGDNIFSYALTPTATGSFTLPVKVLDTQLRTASASIALTVTTPPPTVSIRAIQAAKPSPYAGQTVLTTGIVIGVKSNGFYLEATDADTTPTTPEGILVYTGSTTKPSYIAVGNVVQVTGKVANYSSTPSFTPDTELDAPQTFALISTGNALPAAIPLTTAQDSPSGGIYQFTKYEGMRVSIASLTSTSGTDANLTEQTETQTSNGQFYGVLTGIPRPFREPGISVNDALYLSVDSVPSTVPLWDDNPELLLIDSLSLGGSAINLSTGTTVTNLSGVVDFSTGSPAVLLDATDTPTVSGGLVPTALPIQTAGQFTVGTFNMERFYTSDASAATNPGSSVVVVTPAAYQRRLQKASLAIRTILNNPDVLGCQEIEDLEVLTDLAHQISSDATAAGQPDPAYTPYLFLATDGTGINTGVLVKSTTVDTVSAQQYGLTTTFTTSTGAQATLNDRTPLVMHLGIKRPNALDYPITVIDVHQRSLINVDDPTSTGATVRLKREAQAEYLASLVQTFQANGEHVITVGDFNSFQFNDGFVDTLGVTRGNPVPANQVITPPTANLVTPNLIDLDTLLPSTEYSYVESGSAQYLDHVLITQDLLPYYSHLNFAHIDADSPLVDEDIATSPLRVSDHDPGVAYFNTPAASPALLTTLATPTKYSTYGYQVHVTVTNTGAAAANNVNLTGFTLGGAAPLYPNLPIELDSSLAPGASQSFYIVFPLSAGADNTPSVERLTGTYTGGSFGGGLRVTLP